MEGDGRAPAGIFSFGTAFGYAQEAPTGCKLPYHPATDRDYFVDDPESPQYNQWVTLSSDVSDSQRPWKSAERMRRDDYLYKLGIVVQENTNPAVKGRGSAIFLHIWRAPGLPTVGCTAMEEENLLKLVRWLDPAKNPLLIQAPDDGMNKITMGNGGNQKSK
jgi:L,D-peptidoglycan transpeptidase YkuD (ErfK/YbiS/YcfS/YnhG family)